MAASTSDVPFSSSIAVLAHSLLPSCLDPTELAKLQNTASLSMSTLMLGNIWHQCISTSFPRLATDPSCFEVPQRHDLMRCYGPLRQSILAEGELPLIQSSEEAKQLAKLLHAMEKASARHLGKKGRAANILVGRFKISQSGNNKLSPGAMAPRGPANTFMLPAELHNLVGDPNTALPISLGVTQNSLMLQVGQCHPSQVHAPFMLDIKAACSKGFLNYQEVVLKANGQVWKSRVGIHSLPQLEKSSSCGHVEMLCALLVRDSEFKTQRSVLVETLNLDRMRR